MTEEQKAKAYDEALKRMKSWVRGEHPECFGEAQKAAEFIFPELKESEDERIKKFLITTIRQIPNDSLLWDTIDKSSVLAWLENQSEEAMPKNIDDAALQYVDTCAVDGEVTHGNITEPYWNNHSMMSAYKAGWLKKYSKYNNK